MMKCLTPPGTPIIPKSPNHDFQDMDVLCTLKMNKLKAGVKKVSDQPKFLRRGFWLILRQSCSKDPTAGFIFCDLSQDNQQFLRPKPGQPPGGGNYLAV